MTEIRIDDIRIEHRFRRDYGDIAALAESIKSRGLLQPVGIDRESRLLFGERRIKAHQHLGRETIEARVIDVDSMLLAEHDENELRKDFTPSERVAIGLAIERELGERRGGDHSKRSNCDEWSGRRTDEVAAEKAGFESKDTYRRAKTVVEKGSPELVEAMDKGEASVSAASDIATLPQEEQTEIVAKGEKEILARAKEIRKQRHAEKAAAREQAVAEKTRVEAAGSVRLWRGDAFKAHARFPDDSIDLLLTDPPYSTDVDDIESFSAWMDLWLPKVASHGRAYVFIGSYPIELQTYLSRALAQKRFTLDNILVWTYRNTLGPSPKHNYKLNWQACLHFYGPDAPALDCPVMTEQFSVQDINAPDARTGVRWHAWQKPDEIAERFVRHSTKEGQLVVDPFCGTGTFIAAASKLGRQAIGIDASDEMITICRRRGLEVADAA